MVKLSQVIFAIILLAACVPNEKSVNLTPYQRDIQNIRGLEKIKEYYLISARVDKANDAAASQVSLIERAAAIHNTSYRTIISNAFGYSGDHIDIFWNNLKTMAQNRLSEKRNLEFKCKRDLDYIKCEPD